MLICGLYGSSYGHLEKAMMLKLKLYERQKFMFTNTGPDSALYFCTIYTDLQLILLTPVEAFFLL